MSYNIFTSSTKISYVVAMLLWSASTLEANAQGFLESRNRDLQATNACNSDADCTGGYCAANLCVATGNPWGSLSQSFCNDQDGFYDEDTCVPWQPCPTVIKATTVNIRPGSSCFKDPAQSEENWIICDPYPGYGTPGVTYFIKSGEPECQRFSCEGVIDGTVCNSNGDRCYGDVCEPPTCASYWAANGDGCLTVGWVKRSGVHTVTNPDQSTCCEEATTTITTSTTSTTTTTTTRVLGTPCQSKNSSCGGGATCSGFSGSLLCMLPKSTIANLRKDLRDDTKSLRKNLKCKGKTENTNWERECEISGRTNEWQQGQPMTWITKALQFGKDSDWINAQLRKVVGGDIPYQSALDKLPDAWP